MNNPINFDEKSFEYKAINFVQRAVIRALQLNDNYFEKNEAGGPSHVGTADMVNSTMAKALFEDDADLLIIEEELIPFHSWTEQKTVVFVDPIDGSAELGSGGSQFAAAVTKYDTAGRPSFAAVACPSLRPVFRSISGGFQGFGSSMGAIIFGGLQGVFLLPLFSSQALIPIRLPSPHPVFPAEGSYTSINLDLNLPGMCGLGKHIPNISTALSRMIFSNIFSQCQVILGQANAATLGPSVSVAPNIKSGNGISGPKAWDLVLPILLGVGLEVQTLEHKKISTMTPKYCLDSFVLHDRIIIAHKETIDDYCSDLKNLCSI